MRKTDKRGWKRKVIELEGKAEECWFRCFVKIAYKKERQSEYPWQ